MGAVIMPAAAIKKEILFELLNIIPYSVNVLPSDVHVGSGFPTGFEGAMTSSGSGTGSTQPREPREVN